MQNNIRTQEEEREIFQKSRKITRSPDQVVSKEAKTAQVVHLEKHRGNDREM